MNILRDRDEEANMRNAQYLRIMIEQRDKWLEEVQHELKETRELLQRSVSKKTYEETVQFSRDYGKFIELFWGED